MVYLPLPAGSTFEMAWKCIVQQASVMINIHFLQHQITDWRAYWTNASVVFNRHFHLHLAQILWPKTETQQIALTNASLSAIGGHLLGYCLRLLTFKHHRALWQNIEWSILKWCHVHIVLFIYTKTENLRKVEGTSSAWGRYHYSVCSWARHYMTSWRHLPHLPS